MKSLGEKLRELRKANGLSQKEAAGHLEITISALSQYETDRRTPRNDTLVSLAQLYHTTIDYLLGLINNPLDIQMEEQRDLLVVEKTKEKIVKMLEYFYRLPYNEQEELIDSLYSMMKILSDQKR